MLGAGFKDLETTPPASERVYTGGKEWLGSRGSHGMDLCFDRFYFVWLEDPMLIPPPIIYQKSPPKDQLEQEPEPEVAPPPPVRSFICIPLLFISYRTTQPSPPLLARFSKTATFSVQQPEPEQEPVPESNSEHEAVPPPLTFAPVHPHTQETKEGTGAHDDRPLLATHRVPGSSVPADSNTPRWKRLISHTLPPHEVIYLVEAIFTSKGEVEMIRELRGDDAQAFIDVVHKVCFVLFPSRGRV